MSKTIRYYRPDEIFEVSARTIDGKMWFDPYVRSEFRGGFIAILARAQKKYDVTIYGFFVMSNHYHALYSAPDADSFADFLSFVHAAMANLSNRLHERDGGPVFTKRCHVKPVVADEETLSRRLAYIMGQAIKAVPGVGIEGWRGANSNSALMHGTPLCGTYFDYHQQTLDARRKDGPEPDDAYTEHPEVMLSVLPCWRDLPADEQRRRYRNVAAAAVERFALPDSAEPMCEFTEGGLVQHAGVAGDSVENCHDGPTTEAPQGHDGVGAAAAVAADLMAGALPPETPAATAVPVEAGDSAADGGDADRREAKAEVPGRPKPAKKPRKTVLLIHASSEADEEAYAEEYKSVRQAYHEAWESLAEETRLALQGKRSTAVVFPAHTFPSVARTGRLRRELGLALPPLPLAA